jgi:hypothetical protein
MLPQDSLTQPLRFGLGVGVSSSNSDDPFLTATASKKISLFEGDHTQLTAKARVELDPRSSKVSVLHGCCCSAWVLGVFACAACVNGCCWCSFGASSVRALLRSWVLCLPVGLQMFSAASPPQQLPPKGIPRCQYGCTSRAVEVLYSSE